MNDRIVLIEEDYDTIDAGTLLRVSLTRRAMDGPPSWPISQWSAAEVCKRRLIIWRAR
jgi:hypothetical protein